MLIAGINYQTWLLNINQRTHSFVLCQDFPRVWKKRESWRMWWWWWWWWEVESKHKIRKRICVNTPTQFRARAPASLRMELECSSNVQISWSRMWWTPNIYGRIYDGCERNMERTSNSGGGNEGNITLQCKFNTHFQLYQSPKEISLTFCDYVYEWKREKRRSRERERESTNFWKRVNTARMFRILLFFLSFWCVCV